MLRDVVHNVSDGLLGFATKTGDGRSVKIGVSPVVSDAPIVITGDMDAAKIKSRLGLSPLADAAMDSVQGGAGRTYCFPVAATTAGNIGEVKKTGDGGGTLTTDGSPTNAFSIIVKITAQGGLNTAAFTVSIDGGKIFAEETTVPLNGSHEIAGTGVKVKFAEATEESQKPSSFLVNDTYTFETTAPSMTVGDISAAIDKLKTFNEEYEFCHIVGSTGLAVWQMVSTTQVELAKTYHKPMFFLLEAAYPDAAAVRGSGIGESKPGDLTDWALQMEADRKKIKNTDIQVCAAWGYNRPQASGWFIDQDFIPRSSTSCSVVVQGVKPGVKAELTTMWTLLGYPPTGIAVPLWVKDAGKLLPGMVRFNREHEAALLSDWSLRLADRVFSYKQGMGTGRYLNWERLYSPGKGDGYMTVITEVEDEVFRTTKPLLEEWYKKGSLDTQAIPKLYDELESSIRMIYQSLLESE